MKFISKYFWYIFIIVAIIAIIYQLPNLGKELNTKKELNYIVINNKIVPLTRLSITDSKRLCTDCHKK